MILKFWQNQKKKCHYLRSFAIQDYTRLPVYTANHLSRYSISKEIDEGRIQIPLLALVGLAELQDIIKIVNLIYYKITAVEINSVREYYFMSNTEEANWLILRK